LFRYINSLCIFCTTLEKGENGIPFDGVEFLKPYWEKYEEYIAKLFHSSFFEKLTLANMVIGTYELTDLMRETLNNLLNNPKHKEAINMMLSELGIGNDKIFSAIASEHYINEDCMPDNEGCMPDFDL